MLVGVAVPVERVNEPKPRMEKSVMSLAGGSLVIVGVMRSRVPVMLTVTSSGPVSISDMPPETRPSTVTSK